MLSSIAMSLLAKSTVKTHMSQLWRFAICGGTGFIIDLSSLTLFVEVLGVDPRIAVIFSSIVGATFVFFANKFFTFKNREHKTGSQALKFMLVYGIAIVGNAVIANALLWVGAQYFPTLWPELQYLPAKIIAVGIGAVWNYALSHGFVFKKKEDINVVVA